MINKLKYLPYAVRDASVVTERNTISITNQNAAVKFWNGTLVYVKTNFYLLCTLELVFEDIHLGGNI